MLVRSFIVYIISFSVFFAVFYAHDQIMREKSVKKNWSSVPVQAPSEQPAYSQKSIDLAMQLFAIEVPSSAKPPIFDPNLRDRGITARRGWSGKAEVRIGPAAFSSWGLLGSTLAHEIEIHCGQSFFMISMLDAIGLDGTSLAEREAYLHELQHAPRFNLTEIDQRLIAETLDYYYPEPSNPFASMTLAAQVGKSLRSMLARPLYSR